MTELCHKYRPKKLSEVVGQRYAVTTLGLKLKQGEMPHAVLFHGPTGVGKTTLARIVASEMGVDVDSMIDFAQINCADVRNIDSVRDIIESSRHHAMGRSNVRVWILDEVVQLPKITQQAMLELLEHPPRHCWFLLCTSDTTGLLPTFTSRCFPIGLVTLTERELELICGRALEGEKSSLDGVVMKTITTQARGSGRRALYLLEAALCHKTVDDQLAAIGTAARDDEEQVEFLAKLIIEKRNWVKVVECCRKVAYKDLETMRYRVLDYTAKYLLNCSNAPDQKRCLHVLRCFQEPWTHSGWAGLVAACTDAYYN